MNISKYVYLITLMALVFFTGCTETPVADSPPKELLIYCGATMPKPVQKLAAIFEEQENCTVKIIIGGSGTLYRIIKLNRQGDLFLPGSKQYIDTAKSEGLITESKLLGYNRASLIVAKGNPLDIKPDLNCLTDKKYRIVLGSPDSGSIGKETKRILEVFDIYEEAVDNSLYLTSDSKGIKKAIKNKVADLTLNWHATAVWEENQDSMQALRLPETIALSHQLILGLLSYSTNQQLARKFIDLAISETGNQLFIKYGFGGLSHYD